MRLADDKSDKFWRIETLGSDFVINWERRVTSGRYELKACQDGGQLSEASRRTYPRED